MEKWFPRIGWMGSCRWVPCVCVDWMVIKAKEQSHLVLFNSSGARHWNLNQIQIQHSCSSAGVIACPGSPKGGQVGLTVSEWPAASLRAKWKTLVTNADSQTNHLSHWGCFCIVFRSSRIWPCTVIPLKLCFWKIWTVCANIVPDVRRSTYTIKKKKKTEKNLHQSLILAYLILPFVTISNHKAPEEELRYRVNVFPVTSPQYNNGWRPTQARETIMIMQGL